MKSRSCKGLTLLEMLVVVAIIGIITFAIVQLILPMLVYFQRTPTRQRAQMEMRTCMSTIAHVLANGKSGTLVIATPDATPTIQFSSATFQSQDGSTYSIFWSNTPAKSVHLQRILPNGSVNDTVLATNITNLVFGIAGDDPGIVYVTLQMTVALDSSGTPGSFYTVLLPTQTIRMFSP